MRQAVTAVAGALWFATIGCTSAVQPGLANAPALGGTPVADVRVHDLIANGQDSCGRTFRPDPGPLRYRVPPCTHPRAPVTSQAFSTARTRRDDGAVLWMEHYYSGWPCDTNHEAATRQRRFAPRLSAEAVCAIP